MRTFPIAVLAATVLALSSTLAQAAWVAVEGGVTAKPDETNSTIEIIMLHCMDGPALDVYSRNDGAVLPDDGKEHVADYFYRKAAVRGVVDGMIFPLSAAGSDIAVVIFSEGTEAENYLAPLDPAFVRALVSGSQLTLAFDVTPDAAADGTPFETWATFSLRGAKPVIEAALGCL